MQERQMSLRLRVAVLLVVPVAAQIPQAATLVVESDPGVTIKINGKTVAKAKEKKTTIVVSPGTYRVAVNKGTNDVSCTPASVTIQSGDSQTVQCH
jgi:hypothetical protein